MKPSEMPLDDIDRSILNQIQKRIKRSSISNEKAHEVIMGSISLF